MNWGSLRLRSRLADFREWVNSRGPRKVELVLLTCLVVGLTAVICSVYIPALGGFSEGVPAPRSVTARDPVTVLDVETTNKARADVAELVEPVYLPDPEALPAASAELDVFMQEVERLRQSVPGALDAPGALAELAEVAPSTVSSATLQYLLTAEAGSYQLLRDQISGVLTTLFAGPITKDTEDDAKARLRAIADQLAGSRVAADVIYEVAASYLRPNRVVDTEQWQMRREEAMRQVAPVLLSVAEGEIVVREGEKVSAQQMLTLGALGLTSTRHGWKVWLGVFLVVLLEVAVFSRLLHRFNLVTKTPEYGNVMLLALVFLLLGGTVVARLLLIHPLSAYLIPVAAMGMVVTVILNARSALLMVVLASLNIGLLTDFDMRYTLTALLAGALSLYLVSKVTKRAALLGAALVAMFASAYTIFTVEIFTEATLGQALRASVWGFGNGFLVGVLTILLLLLLEGVLNLTTPLRLLELADPAHPLLKKLLQVAPGTYNHSIMMGNLAEAGAQAIGANSSLARVGAYYHDIGKTVRPEYFIENQIYVGNPHDALSPNLSKLAITAHVRDGEDLGTIYGLPQPVVDIIKQHHGTSLLSFFYHKAQENSKEPVYEESYRYESEKPRSKEAAIVMLADGVEAAVRALENPTRRKIQGVIQEIIRQRVQDGQLDESALTQSDLRRLSESFDTSLLGLLGHRVRYPGPKDAQGDE
jgi:putative nucleotidyltransferase with HDIG domain